MHLQSKMNTKENLMSLDAVKVMLANVINANMQQYSGQVGTGKRTWYNSCLDAMGSISVAIQQLSALNQTEKPSVGVVA